MQLFGYETPWFVWAIAAVVAIILIIYSWRREKKIDRYPGRTKGVLMMITVSAICFLWAWLISVKTQAPNPPTAFGQFLDGARLLLVNLPQLFGWIAAISMFTAAFSSDVMVKQLNTSKAG